MDYAIYKTTDGRHPRAVHKFTQQACNHRAKRCAREKLKDMWLHVLKNAPERFRNLDGCTPDEFSYDYISNELQTERIRFYIGQII